MLNSHFNSNLAPASYAQARIWFDERVRFNSDKPPVAIYNMPFLYQLHSKHTLSIKQLRHALQLMITKHLSLRTSFTYDKETNVLTQRINDFNDQTKQLFTFIQSTFDTDEQLTDIMHNEKRNSQLFNLAEGLVFRCHLVHFKSDKDAIIFNFHHAVFDFLSMDVFLRDLDEAYTTSQLLTNEADTLRYLDCKSA